MQAYSYTIIEAVEEFGPIVHVDADLSMIFCWNLSHTFNILTNFNGRYQVIDAFQDYDIMVNGADSLAKVIARCQRYCESLHEELNEEYA